MGAGVEGPDSKRCRRCERKAWRIRPSPPHAGLVDWRSSVRGAMRARARGARVEASPRMG
eukprot:scaffold7589_cov403-Prasinococcus_capsulatus_cf.AAC.1